MGLPTGEPGGKDMAYLVDHSEEKHKRVGNETKESDNQ
jgi:hypothetical protein